MRCTTGIRQPGIAAALGSAVLFGCGTPLAKMLLSGISPWLLAGLLYLGSGVGLALYRRIRRARTPVLTRGEIGWLIGANTAGGLLAPVLLMAGLTAVPASTASLLLNAEGVFTALLAWFVFRENFDRRIALGMAAILLGALILSWPARFASASVWPAVSILGACAAWGIDNNLTRKVALADATWLAMTKGLAAGSVNLLLALLTGAVAPGWPSIGMAMAVGFLAYGVSLALFVIALRQLGTARAGAYFSVAPFIGALVAVFLGEQVTAPLLIAGSLMALGVWLHLTETHEHEHFHAELEHEHEHVHDEHHQHDHDEPVAAGVRHTHRHRHLPLVHSHAHFPDAHHRHEH
ncbi:MAG TPA: DMT family transporter [Povalibacter sp.]|nr:DMT family transporter [Povalibacter sp.]